MGKYSLVLSDSLQTEYYKFKNGKDYDPEIIKRLLHYYKAPILTNTSQLKRTNTEVEDRLLQNLRHAGYTTQTLEQLAAMTVYKIVLSVDQDTYPFVNINADKIENNLSGCFFRNESRQKAIDHITALCSKAKEICIYDLYFCHAGISNCNTLAALLPKKKLSITYDPSHVSTADIQSMEKRCRDWSFQPKTLLSNHDRYLIIDNEMEIILTSGFSYLNSKAKEFTYVIRPVSEQRFSSEVKNIRNRPI